MRRKLHGKRAPAKQLAQPNLAHPRSIATIAAEGALEQAPDQPFVEGARDEVDPDLRHRMISEAAFHRYAERGYEEGYDREDWLEAEAQVDHVIVSPRPPGEA